MNQTVRLDLISAWARLAAFCLFALITANPAAFSQNSSNVFSTGGDSQLHYGEDTEVELDFDITSPDPDAVTAIFTPAQGQAIARVRVVDGTVETLYTAQRIEYSVADGAFLLQGNARIERTEGFLFGPAKIEFIPERNIMYVMGTGQTPAEIDYPLRNRQFSGRAREFHFNFQLVEGRQELSSIKTVGSLGGRSIPGDFAPAGQAPMRRLSGPGSSEN